MIGDPAICGVNISCGPPLPPGTASGGRSRGAGPLLFPRIDSAGVPEFKAKMAQNSPANGRPGGGPPWLLIAAIGGVVWWMTR